MLNINPHRAILASLLLLTSLLLLAISLMVSNTSAQTGPSALPQRRDTQIEYWIDSHRLADPQTEPRIARAYQIFERVRAAAVVPGWRSAHLRILASPGRPWAVALPDGYIVLTRGAVELCYQDGDPLLGDARLAFIFGHELAHMAKDDFWHDRVYRALMDNPDEETAALQALFEHNSDVQTGNRTTTPEQREARRLKEIEADDWGFLYAAVAGFPVQRLLGAPDRDTADATDFFHFWAEHTGVPPEGGAYYPSATERAALLRTRLTNTLGGLEVWRFGVRLLHAGRLDDARVFLTAFQERFPAAEVLNNLGYIALRQALDSLPAERAQRFWLPTVFEIDTRAEALVTKRATATLPPETKRLLDKAVRYLQQSSTLDPEGSAAWVNLAIARLLLGETHLARHAIDQALALQADDPALLALQAVIIAESDPELDLWPQALTRLDALLERHPESVAVRWNLARLLDERGRTAAAAPHWDWLRERVASLPSPYANALCDQTEAKCPALTAPVAPAFPWPLPVALGSDFSRDPTLAAPLQGGDWQQLAFDFGGPRQSGRIHWNADQQAVLVLDHYVDLVALTGTELGNASTLREQIGQPRSIQQVPGAELWDYGHWGMIVRDDRIDEAWVMRPAG